MESVVPNLIPAIPELFLVCAGMALLMLGVFARHNATGFIGWMTAGALTLSLVLVVLGGQPAETVVTFNGLFLIDTFTGYAKILALIAAIGAVVMSMAWLKAEDQEKFEFHIVVLFAVIGMMMMISANDLIALYMGLELQSLALYVLAAFRRTNVKATEAGMKYFILGAVASGMLLYGSSLVYGYAGTTQFDAIAEVVAGSRNVGLVIGLVFVMVGLAFKVSAAPFHMWTPDVYEGAPTPVTAFFAGAPKVAALALFARVMAGPFESLTEDWQQVVVALAVLSMLVGAFAAVVQTSIKRLMAYSSIGHVGFALVGLAAASHAGMRGLMFYLLVYVVMNMGVFAVILSMRIKGRYVEQISDLAGISRTNPGMALAMTVLMFSMAGIPPAAGFLAKFYVFMSAVEAGLVPLAVIGVLASVVSAFYYLRIVKVMYFDENTEALDAPTRTNALIFGASGVLMLVMFVLPSVLVGGADRAATALFALG